MARPRSENPRSVLMAMRITPRMRFGLELLAQRDRCSMSEVVLRAIDARLEDAALGLQLVAKGERKPSAALDRTWGPHERERVVRLGLWYEALLNDAQRYIWRTIRETPKYWRAGSAPDRPVLEDIRWEVLAKDWPRLEQNAKSVR